MKALVLTFALFLPVVAFSAEEQPAVLQEVGIDPKLGTQLPLHEEFLDENGRTVTLGSFFDGKKPVALLFNYYGCPMLCGLLLNGARDGFESINWLPGDHYKIVTISVDPKEEFDLAASKKSSILESLKQEKFRQAAAAHWHFLVGKNGSEARVAAAAGFRYKWVKEEKQYAHGAALYLATPDGKLSRVLLGIKFEPRDLKFSLLEASAGKVGTFAEKLMLFCYHLVAYDPKDNKNVLLASRLVAVGGGATVAAIFLGYLVLYLRNRRKGKACSLSP